VDEEDKHYEMVNGIDKQGVEDFERDKKIVRVNSTPFFGNSTYWDWFIDYQIERNINKDSKDPNAKNDIIKHNKMKSTYGKDFCDRALRNLKRHKKPEKQDPDKTLETLEEIGNVLDRIIE